jgi:hypothetical protein
VKGQEYGGAVCHAELSGAVDAYEWSFVAVPAQRNAGVIKKFGGGEMTEKEFEELKRYAALGRKYLGELRKEVLRLSLACGDGLYETVRGAVPVMDETALCGMKAMLEKKSLERFPPVTQLPGEDAVTAFDGSEFKI